MLTKQEFVEKMKELQSLEVKQNKFCDDMDKYFECGTFNLGYDLIDFGISLLCELVGDKDQESWIYWFIYENDWGKRGFDAGYDGKTKKIKTIEQLYDLIVKRNESKGDRE